MQTIGRIVSFDSFREIIEFIRKGGQVRFDDQAYVQPYGRGGKLLLSIDTFNQADLFYEHDWDGMTEEPFDVENPPEVIHVIFTAKNANLDDFTGYELTGND